MEPRTTYCEHCRKPVHLKVTPVHRSGHASLPDGGQLVCLDFGRGCDGSMCPISGLPTIVMGVRLARSGEDKTEPWPHVSAVCEGCGNEVDMEVLDGEHAFCPRCGTTNTLVMLPLDDESFVAVAGKPRTA